MSNQAQYEPDSFVPFTFEDRSLGSWVSLLIVDIAIQCLNMFFERLKKMDDWKGTSSNHFPAPKQLPMQSTCSKCTVVLVLCRLCVCYSLQDQILSFVGYPVSQKSPMLFYWHCHDQSGLSPKQVKVAILCIEPYQPIWLVLLDPEELIHASNMGSKNKMSTSILNR